MPSADLLGTVRGVNNAPDKRQGLANIPSHNGKEKGSQPSNASDSAQRKQQILLQQALPPVAPNNILVYFSPPDISDITAIYIYCFLEHGNYFVECNFLSRDQLLSFR